jgi:predicted O-methyltransferase YrrM
MSLIKKSIKIIKEEGLIRFFIRCFNFLKSRIVKILIFFNKSKIINQLRTFSSDNSDEVFDFSCNFYHGFIKPIQIKEEFAELLKIFYRLHPKYVLEIGTANGGTLFCFCKLANSDATIISIDLPSPLGGYPEWKISFYQSFTKKDQKLYLLKKDSHKINTLEEVKKILDGNQLDFLFIDGDHSYEGVKKDFEMYSPLVKKGGIIAFHDIALQPEFTKCYVHNFWREIKNKTVETREIIGKKNDFGINYGIGIILIK